MGGEPENRDDAIGAAENAPGSTQDYSIGYKHPPSHTQFKKGQSGNPDGRPKKVKRPLSLADELLAIFLKPIIVNENGHRTKITKRQAMLIQLVNKALHGDLKALAMILRILQTFSSDPVPDDRIVTEDGRLIMPIRKISLEKLEHECFRRFGPNVIDDTAFGSCPVDRADTTPQGKMPLT
jgi:hypothetical protein